MVKKFPCQLIINVKTKLRPILPEINFPKKSIFISYI